MKKIICSSIFLAFALSAFSQINSKDSTYLAKAHWNINETQSYSVTNKKLRIKQNSDTTVLMTTKYDVDITVIDTSKAGYTLNWHYKNIEMLPENKLSKAVLSITNNMNTHIKTDPSGAFLELANWQEISEFVKKSAQSIKIEMADVPNIDKVLSQIEQMYSTKETIEGAVIKEIQQFYHFYGGKYKLGVTKTDAFKLPNIGGGEPFDANSTSNLEEIDSQNDNVIIRYWHSIDQNQLRQAAHQKIAAILTAANKEIPSIEQLGAMKNETLILSRIHARSGWVIYSLQAQEVSADGISSIDECIIELK